MTMTEEDRFFPSVTVNYINISCSKVFFVLNTRKSIPKIKEKVEGKKRETEGKGRKSLYKKKSKPIKQLLEASTSKT